MECNQENLHTYLDGEMDPPAKKQLEEHLGRCRSCRQELARLQLLWLQLDQPDKVDLPLELLFLRQQIIHQASSARQAGKDRTYWDSQKLAWQPALAGAGYIPGVGLLSTVTQATAHQIPRLLAGTVTLARRLMSSGGDKRGGRR